MAVQFGGITYITGPVGRVMDYALDRTNADAGAIAGTKQLKEDLLDVVILDGPDLDTFLKREFNISFPQELHGVNQDDFMTIVTDPGNRKRYGFVMNQFYTEVMKSSQFTQKILQYFEEAKAHGHKDIDGRPIQEIRL